MLIALARHFAKPENRPARTLVLIASAGHHSGGLNGPRGFMTLNPELAKRAITVNCVAPGLIETQMIAGLPLDQIKDMIPLRRIGRPEDVAAAVSFLCSDDAGYVTRQVISVNGGMV